MKITTAIVILAIIVASCHVDIKTSTTGDALPLQGTWKLLTGTLTEKGKATVTDYTKGQSFIKIINDSHFAFFLHDLNHGKDSTHIYSSGGGSYTLKDSSYTEHLEYCDDRQWENHDFPFTITIQNDTLTITGIEKIDSIGVNRLNIEKYVRLK